MGGRTVCGPGQPVWLQGPLPAPLCFALRRLLGQGPGLPWRTPLGRLSLNRVVRELGSACLLGGEGDGDYPEPGVGEVGFPAFA